MTVSLFSPFKLWCYGLFTLFLAVGLPTDASSAEFTNIKWFQITFGENIKHVELLPAASPEQLPAIAIASDPFKASGTIQIYQLDLLSGQTREKHQIQTAADFPKVSVAQAVPSRDGKKILITNNSHEVFLYDLANKSLLKRFSGHRHGSTFAAFSGDEQKIAVVDEWRSVWVWEVEGDPETPVQVFEMPQWVGRVEFAEGDSKVRVYGEETISVYNVETGRLESYKEMNPRLNISRMHRPESILVSEDGSAFFSEHRHDNGDSGAMGRFDRLTGAKIWSSDFGKIDPPPGWPTMANLPTGYVLTKNSAYLVVGDHGGYRVLDPLTGQLKFRQRLNASGYYLRLSLDGRYLLDLGGSNVTVYRVPSECGG